jgi:uncharacterized protein YndB with AHSA1/START domain
MTTTDASTRCVIVEKEFPHSPEKVWRALTEGPLIDQWLMKNDFQPVAGHRFKLSAEWGSVDCEVLAVEPQRALSYTWGAYGLETVVTWTLTRTDAGTLVRMEQAGFRLDHEQAYKGAGYGWQKFFGGLERVVGGLE